jgi:hypothetical protein
MYMLCTAVLELGQQVVTRYLFYGTSVREQSGLMQAMQVIVCIRARQGDRLMSSVLMESTPRHVRFYMPLTICIRYVLR